MASTQQKQKLFMIGGLGLGLGLLFLSTSNDAKAAARAPDEDDDLPEPQSPGWPPTTQLPQQPPNVVELPEVPGPIPTPINPGQVPGTTTQLPPSVQVPPRVTLPRPVEPPEVVEMPEYEPGQDQEEEGPAPTPTMEQGERETVIPSDTAKLLQTMLALESTSNWKRVEAALKPWQSKRKLVADGKFGPKSAATMAQETGLLPIIRFWTAGTSPEKAVPAYHDTLIQIAEQAEEPRRTQLHAAVEREQGQAFARNPGPVVPTISLS